MKCFESLFSFRKNNRQWISQSTRFLQASLMETPNCIIPRFKNKGEDVFATNQKILVSRQEFFSFHCAVVVSHFYRSLNSVLTEKVLFADYQKPCMSPSHICVDNGYFPAFPSTCASINLTL